MKKIAFRKEEEYEIDDENGLTDNIIEEVEEPAKI